MKDSKKSFITYKVWRKHMATKQKLRIEAFDDLLNTLPIEQYGENMTVCKCYDGVTGTKLTPDHIDRWFDEFVNSKFHIAFQFVYVIPGGFDITIPITNRDSLSWSSETKDGKVYARIRFIMSDEEYGNQITALRKQGYNINMVKLSEFDYIDFGELNPECIIRFEVDPENCWNIRSENIKIANRDPAIEPEPGKLLSLAVEKYPDVPEGVSLSKAQAGMVCLAIATGLDLFSDDQISRAVKYGEIIDGGSVSIHTDKDCELPEVPEGYDPLSNEDPPEALKDKITQYEKDMKDVIHRRKIWSTIFQTNNTFVKSMFEAWVATLEHPKNDSHMQVYLSQLMQWLKGNNSLDTFMKELFKNEQDTIAAQNIDFTTLKILPEHIVKYGDVVKLARIFSEKMTQLAKERNIDLKTNNADPVFASMIQNLPEVKQYESLGLSLAADIAIANDLLIDGNTLLTKEALDNRKIEDFPIVTHILVRFPEIFGPYVDILE